MDAMTTAPRYAPQGWTFPQAVLAAACIVIGTGIAAFGFIDLYLTITHLIAPWWGSWAWTVILLGEGAALGAYLASLLALLRLVSVPRALAVFLGGYLALFAAGSLTLMLYAGRVSAPDLVSHAIVPVSFFGYLLLAKVLVRHLSAAPPTALDGARADARRYAMDLLRDRKGITWRWRPSVPSLLRRQVFSGRFPATVAAAVRESLREYGEPWEPAVRSWVLGAEGLNLTARAEADAQKAASAIASEAPVAVPVGTPAPRQPARQNGAPDRAKARAKAKRLLTDNPGMLLADVAARTGLSERTVSRIKADLPTPLRVAK